MQMMHYRINQIKLKIGEPKEKLVALIEKKLRLKKGAVKEWEIRRESIDARDKSQIRLVYTIDFYTDKPVNSKLVTLVDEEKERPYEPAPGDRAMKGRPVIAGFGPCGIFAALELARRGYRPIVLERGKCMEERVSDVENFRNNQVLDTESNMLFGEGGAGTFSDGKLTSGIKDGNIRKVLAIFHGAGAGDDILYLHRPHIGTDVLKDVIVNLRKEICALGGEVRFGTKLLGFELEAGHLKSVRVGGPDGQYDIETEALILAVGHSARDTFEMINNAGLNMEQKPFSIGVRMEHPQSLIDHAQYGDEDRLPPADYKVNYHASNGRGVYSFCMCPGGEVVVCSNREGELCVNGMSNRKRDSGTANSGILCDLRTEDFGSDDVLAGVRFQEKWERIAFENGGGNFNPPTALMKDFLEGNDKAAPVINSLPDFAAEAIREAVPHFARRIKGYDMPDAVIKATETRSSSPVRILRDDACQSNIPGIYPAGEGAGYAGGITSAACDGIKAAQAIIASFAPDSEVK